MFAEQGQKKGGGGGRWAPDIEERANGQVGKEKKIKCSKQQQAVVPERRPRTRARCVVLDVRVLVVRSCPVLDRKSNPQKITGVGKPRQSEQTR